VRGRYFQGALLVHRYALLLRFKIIAAMIAAA
jgi:hypothetical protein